MTSTENRPQVTLMVIQRFTHYATAALSPLVLYKVVFIDFKVPPDSLNFEKLPALKG